MQLYINLSRTTPVQKFYTIRKTISARDNRLDEKNEVRAKRKKNDVDDD